MVFHNYGKSEYGDCSMGRGAGVHARFLKEPACADSVKLRLSLAFGKRYSRALRGSPAVVKESSPRSTSSHLSSLNASDMPAWRCCSREFRLFREFEPLKIDLFT